VTLRVDFDPTALDELHAAHRWYEHESPGVRDEFADEVWRVIDFAAEWPGDAVHLADVAELGASDEVVMSRDVDHPPVAAGGVPRGARHRYSRAHSASGVTQPRASHLGVHVGWVSTPHPPPWMKGQHPGFPRNPLGLYNVAQFLLAELVTNPHEGLDIPRAWA
jgi:hypothetical protein